MKPEILDFLHTERIGVLAVEMPGGAPHGATVHFAHREEPLTFIFETSRTYRKSEPLLSKETTRASFVLGFEEGSASKTFQLDGIARLLTENEGDLQECYLEKFPEKREKAKDPKNIFFLFTPSWWRFTDYSGPGGKSIYSSEDGVASAEQ